MHVSGAVADIVEGECAIGDSTKIVRDIVNTVALHFNNLPESQQSYRDFGKICNSVGKEKLPPKLTSKSATADHIEVSNTREATLRSNFNKLAAAQINHRQMFNRCKGEKN
uniref:Uncharacterized protein n=1 Tax=Octopus bimaculoides TaxID=37653 RepID=A0A0L8IBT5_OCTBM